jgi:hypothetical protein
VCWLKHIGHFGLTPKSTQTSELAFQNGYTVTGALEKFMSTSIAYGLVFPAAKTGDVEAEARIMLAWLRQGEFWVDLDGKEETSVRGRLLRLLPSIADAKLKADVEEELKKKP